MGADSHTGLAVLFFRSYHPAREAEKSVDIALGRHKGNLGFHCYFFLHSTQIYYSILSAVQSSGDIRINKILSQPSNRFTHGLVKKTD